MLRPQDERTVSVERAADHLRSFALLSRKRFARDHGLVHRTRSGENHAIDRNFLARPHTKAIALLHFRKRNIVLRFVGCHAACDFGREVQEGANRAAGAAARAQLEHLPEEHENGDGRRCFEVHLGHAVRAAQTCGKHLWRDGSHRAVQVRNAHAHADQREHVGAAEFQRGGEALEERPAAPQHNGSCEDKLNPGNDTRAPGVGERSEHVAHRQRQQWHAKGYAPPEASRHLDKLRIGLLRSGHRPWLEGHTALRATSRVIAHHLRMHRADVLGFRRRGSQSLGFEGHAALWTDPRPRLPNFRIHGAGIDRRRNGRRCGLGWSRSDGYRCMRHPAGNILRIKIFRRVGLELCDATFAAEIVGLSAVLDRSGGTSGVDVHATNRILHDQRRNSRRTDLGERRGGDRHRGVRHACRLVIGIKILLVIHFEPAHAGAAAEVIPFPLVVEHSGGLLRIDHHSADNIFHRLQFVSFLWRFEPRPALLGIMGEKLFDLARQLLRYS